MGRAPANGRWTEMMRYLGAFAMAAPLLVAVVAEPALAQKSGGILKMYSPDSPASMSIHEEATFVAEGPMMGVFNNLVMGALLGAVTALGIVSTAIPAARA